MGNRAVLSFDAAPDSTGVYLHCYGGPESVLAFLDAARQLGISRGEDKPYFFARFCQIVGNFLGGTESLGVARLIDLDCKNGDNGLYLLDDNLEIVERRYSSQGQKTVKDLDAQQLERYNLVLAAVLEANKWLF